MAIKTRKISDWLSANGQAVTNASLNTMKPYLEKNMAQLYDGVFIMYHRATLLSRLEIIGPEKARI